MSIRTIVLIFVAALVNASASAQTSGPISADAARPPSAPLVTADTTSLACYFKNASGSVTWQWGLTPANKWYELTGTWFTTAYTKLQKFSTGTTTGPLNDACAQSLSYYKLTGYSLFAYFAAAKAAGYNYPIISCGVELFPNQ